MGQPVTKTNPNGAGRPPASKNIQISDNALFNKLTKSVSKLPQKALDKLVKEDPAKYMNILQRLQKDAPNGEGAGTVMKYFFFPAKNLSDAKMKAHLLELYNLLEEKKIRFKKFTGEDEN